MLTTGSWYFQIGTVSLCRLKGCKVTVCQTLRMIQSSRTRTRATRPLTYRDPEYIFKKMLISFLKCFCPRGWQHFKDSFCSLKVTPGLCSRLCKVLGTTVHGIFQTRFHFFQDFEKQVFVLFYIAYKLTSETFQPNIFMFTLLQ